MSGARAWVVRPLLLQFFFAFPLISQENAGKPGEDPFLVFTVIWQKKTAILSKVPGAPRNPALPISPDFNSCPLCSVL